MSASRIWLVSVILGLSACSGGSDTPPPAPSAVNALPLPEPAAPVVAPAPPQPAVAAVLEKSITNPPSQAVRDVAAPVAMAPTPAVQASQPAAPPVESLPLDLKALKKQLKETKSIGLFSKMSLKNKVDDLLDHFRKYYDGKGKMNLAELRESYNLLMMKVLSMLQDADQTLSAAIVSSREAIWDLLSDPKKFASLDI